MKPHTFIRSFNSSRVVELRVHREFDMTSLGVTPRSALDSLNHVAETIERSEIFLASEVNPAAAAAAAAQLNSDHHGQTSSKYNRKGFSVLFLTPCGSIRANPQLPAVQLTAQTLLRSNDRHDASIPRLIAESPALLQMHLSPHPDIRN